MSLLTALAHAVEDAARDRLSLPDLGSDDFDGFRHRVTPVLEAALLTARGAARQEAAVMLLDKAKELRGLAEGRPAAPGTLPGAMCYAASQLETMAAKIGGAEEPQ